MNRTQLSMALIRLGPPIVAHHYLHHSHRRALSIHLSSYCRQRVVEVGSKAEERDFESRDSSQTPRQIVG